MGTLSVHRVAGPLIAHFHVCSTSERRRGGSDTRGCLHARTPCPSRSASVSGVSHVCRGPGAREADSRVWSDWNISCVPDCRPCMAHSTPFFFFFWWDKEVRLLVIKFWLANSSQSVTVKKAANRQVTKALCQGSHALGTRQLPCEGGASLLPGGTTFTRRFEWGRSPFQTDAPPRSPDS